MENWDEVRTAYQVARLGTVSGAAEVLGVHHATVIRHIDALETRLGVKLFQRHARGYTATEAGEDLLVVAQTTEDQFNQLAGRVKGRGESITGDLVVTSLAIFAQRLTPVLVDFQRANEGLRVRYLTGDRLFRLEYGEAHVAIRSGPSPQEPDNVVQPFISQGSALVAAQSYIDRYGFPKNEADLKNHWFVGHDSAESRAPFFRWLAEYITPDRYAYRVTDTQAMREAIIAGAGIGFVSRWELERLPDLTEVLPSNEAWKVPSWIVTHVDLHRTPKVQAFVKFLKEKSKDWDK